MKHVKRRKMEERFSKTTCNVLDDMRKSHQLCDVILQVDEKQFPVHRNILSACSPYFRALFTNGMHESSESIIKIPGTKPHLMERILDYAYTRQTVLTEEIVVELLPAADQFNVQGLVDICCDYLIAQLLPANAIGFWRFAHDYFCFRLEEAAFRYILIHFEDVALHGDNEEFLSLKIEEFEDIVSQDRLNVKMEEYVFEAVLKWVKHNEMSRVELIDRLLLHIRLGMINTDYFMNNIKRHPYVKNNEKCKQLIVQTIHYTYNFNTSNHEGPSSVISRPRLPNQLLFALGGWSGGSPTSAIECYDTRADRWVLVDTENNRPRAYMGIAVLGKRLYAVGGFDSNQYFNSVRCFDPTTKRWKEVAPMNSRRCYVSVAVLNGCIYAMGGFDGHTRLRSVERYHPRTNQWSIIHPMNHHRSDACATSHKGKIIIVGGFNGNECLSTAESFTPDADEWRDLPRMNSRRSGVGLVSFRDSVYAVGGFNGLTRLNTMEKYSAGDMQWTPCPSMYIHRSNFGVAVMDDMLFVIGGFNGITTIYNVECFDPDNDEWYDACDMNVYRSALSIGVVSGLPNVEEFTWPRDRQLPPPSVVPSHGVPATMDEADDTLSHDHNHVMALLPNVVVRDQNNLEQRDAAEEAEDEEEDEDEDDSDDDDVDADEDDGDVIAEEEEVQLPERPPNPHRHPLALPPGSLSSSRPSSSSRRIQ